MTVRRRSAYVKASSGALLIALDEQDANARLRFQKYPKHPASSVVNETVIEEDVRYTHLCGGILDEKSSYRNDGIGLDRDRCGRCRSVDESPQSQIRGRGNRTRRRRRIDSRRCRPARVVPIVGWASRPSVHQR